MGKEYHGKTSRELREFHEKDCRKSGNTERGTIISLQKSQISGGRSYVLRMEILFKDLSYAIVGAAMEVHRVLGPGFLESVYAEGLACELEARGIYFVREVRIPVDYKGKRIGDYKADFLVDNKIILELKAVSALLSVHAAQAQHYLAATGANLAILLNFGAPSLQYKRVIRQLSGRSATFREIREIRG